MPEWNAWRLETSDINVNILSYLPISQDQYVKFQQETAADPDLQLLQDTVLHGWPETKGEMKYSQKYVHTGTFVMKYNA